MPPSYEDLSEYLDTTHEPFLDRPEIYAQSEKLPDIQRIWTQQGAVVVENMIPHALIDQYLQLRMSCPDERGFMSGDQASPCPYWQYKEIRNLSLYPEVCQIMKALIGEDCGLHLNLCNTKSTRRDWHSDNHLNPDFVNGYYLASWIALEDIHPDSGPFEFVPGSHRWPVLKRSKIWKHMSHEETLRPDWPELAERLLTPAIEEKIKKENVPVMSFTAKKGDILFWHSALIHRGSVPKNPDMTRLALISHYSSIYKRPDMHQGVARWGEGYYFIHPQFQLNGNCPAPTI
jgi:phytanoyl-CoA dioxygenase PhyH